jgi:hypothetical protein
MRHPGLKLLFEMRHFGGHGHRAAAIPNAKTEKRLEKLAELL